MNLYSALLYLVSKALRDGQWCSRGMWGPQIFWGGDAVPPNDVMCGPELALIPFKLHKDDSWESC